MRVHHCLFALALAIPVIGAPVGLTAADRLSTKIIMLGTGTPRPNPDRSGPATAIVVGDRAYLIDFGPGVVRRAAAAAAKGYPAVEPTKIKVAFLTHLHSDHTAGYPDLMLTPWIFGRNELDVYGPEGTEEMTEHLRAAYRRDIENRTQGMEHASPLVVRAHDVRPGIVYKDDRVTVKAFPVAHGEWPQAFGYRFETPDRIIVISGDTSPSKELIANCQPCDVLIHEVQSTTYNVETIPDWPAYRARYHTTTDQLADIANRTKPGLLIVYHNAANERGLQEILRQIQRTYHGRVVIGHDLDVF
ncbi:MAG TPA: MBL fold metallo-hydrolase [Terriglobales bacterium]|nr:MBL fold metallo-hydrolase [Terriglobales bacterium]